MATRETSRASAISPAPLLRRPLSAAAQDGSGHRGLMFTVGPLVVVIICAAVAVGSALRWLQPTALRPLGLVVLVVAVVLGLPHGALDVSLMSGQRRGFLVRSLGYAAAAAAVYVLWWHWPAAGVAVLLAVSAAHFALSDQAVNRWRSPFDLIGTDGWSIARAGATGTLAVAGPFAVWPTQTTVILEQLHAGGGAGAIIVASRVLSVLAIAAGAPASVAAARRGDRTGAAEFWLLAALVVTCPPLLAFGVYFAAWHSLRQTARLLVVHPEAARRIKQQGVSAAARHLARQAVLPTAAAAVALAVIGLHHTGVTATVLIGLLAVSVPHALVTGIAEHRRPPVAFAVSASDA